MFEAPDANDVEPTTVTDADSIRADGAYRDWIDCSLTDLSEMAGNDALGHYGPLNADDCVAVRDRATTVYDVRTVGEARALAAACERTIRGNHVETTTTKQAVERVGDRAAHLAAALRPEAHGIDTGSDDETAELVTDGGTARPTHNADAWVRPDGPGAGEDGAVRAVSPGAVNTDAGAADASEGDHGTPGERPTYWIEDDGETAEANRLARALGAVVWRYDAYHHVHASTGHVYVTLKMGREDNGGDGRAFAAVAAWTDRHGYATTTWSRDDGPGVSLKVEV
jgi:hypothetical protein